MKICSHCKLEKPLSEFGRNRSRKDGFAVRCKACERTRCLTAMRKYLITEAGREQHRSSNRKACKKRSVNGKNQAYLNSKPLFKLSARLRTLVNNAMRRKGWKKQSKTQKLLGCSFEEFKLHIEQQFEPGMTWENQGEWHYDHVIPCNCAENILELEALQHWSNFRPLWGCDNLSKGATPPDNWKERLAELIALLDK